MEVEHMSKTAFVGFGEVNTPIDIIVNKCKTAEESLKKEGLDLISLYPVTDDYEEKDIKKACICRLFALSKLMQCRVFSGQILLYHAVFRYYVAVYRGPVRTLRQGPPLRAKAPLKYFHGVLPAYPYHRYTALASRRRDGGDGRKRIPRIHKFPQ